MQLYLTIVYSCCFWAEENTFFVLSLNGGSCIALVEIHLSDIYSLYPEYFRSRKETRNHITITIIEFPFWAAEIKHPLYTILVDINLGLRKNDKQPVEPSRAFMFTTFCGICEFHWFSNWPVQTNKYTS